MSILLPLFLQRQRGVDTAPVRVSSAAPGGGAGRRQRLRGRSQDLLSPAFLSGVLMLRRLCWGMLGLPGEGGMRRLLFGRPLRAVEVRCGTKREDVDACTYTDTELSNCLQHPLSVSVFQTHSLSCNKTFKCQMYLTAF